MNKNRLLGFAGLSLLAAVVAVVLIFALRSFGGGEAESGERPLSAPVRTKLVDGQTHVMITPTEAAASGILTQSLSSISYQGQASGLATVVSSQTLAEQLRLYQSASADVTRSAVNVRAARLEVQRLQPLHQADRIVSDKALETAQNTFATEEANLRVASAQLQTQQATLREQWGPVLGTWLTDNAPDLNRLFRGQDILLQIALPVDQGVTDPTIGQIEVAPGTKLQARIISLIPQTDPKFQGQSFYALMPADRRLRPGMTAPADLVIGAVISGVVVPDSAVLRWRGENWVYLAVNDGEYARVNINSQTPVSGGWLVTSGLAAGTTVVVRGAQLLLSEELKAVAGSTP